MRPVRIGGAFSLHRKVGPAARWFTALRGALHRGCVALNDTAQCTSHRPPPESDASGRVASIAALYWRSTFCLQPIGDGVSRAGIIDALLLGCIPVLFSDGQVRP